MRLFLATRNVYKAQEIRAILPGPFEYLTFRDLPGAPEVIEDAPTFQGNAIKKAVTLAQWVAAQPAFASPPGLALADDSGLEVDALGGAPGVHSARYAALDNPLAGGKANSPDADNNHKLLRALESLPLEKRTARFRCVLALVSLGGSFSSHDPAVADGPRLFEGVCEGHIALAPRGSGGFGYDPLFIPRGYDVSFAELGEELKNRLSHRAQALARLKAFLDSQTPGH